MSLGIKTLYPHVVSPYLGRTTEGISRLLKQQSVQKSLKSHREPSTVFFPTNTAERNQQSIIWSGLQNQLQSVQICILRPDRKITENAGFQAQKSCLGIWSFSHECHHHMDFENIEVVGHDANYNEQLFLGAWMSLKTSTLGMTTLSCQILSSYTHTALPAFQFWKVFKSRITSSVFLNWWRHKSWLTPHAKIYKSVTKQGTFISWLH